VDDNNAFKNDEEWKDDEFEYFTMKCSRKDKFEKGA